MPENSQLGRLERVLKERAKARGWTGERRNAYVYGTIDRIKRERKAKRARQSA